MHSDEKEQNMKTDKKKMFTDEVCFKKGWEICGKYGKANPQKIICFFFFAFGFYIFSDTIL